MLHAETGEQVANDGTRRWNSSTVGYSYTPLCQPILSISPFLPALTNSLNKRVNKTVFSNYTNPALGESVLWGRHLRSWQDRGAAGRTRWSRGRDLGEGTWETAVGSEGSFLQGHLNFCTVTVKPGQTEEVCPPGHTTRTWTPIGPEIRNITVLEDA